jgi:hypothetical protein
MPKREFLIGLAVVIGASVFTTLTYSQPMTCTPSDFFGNWWGLQSGEGPWNHLGFRYWLTFQGDR